MGFSKHLPSMKKLALALMAALLFGCATDPLLTGLPQDWQGKPAADLRAAWGEPTRTISESGGVEVWEYLKAGDFVAPKREDTSFRVGGGGGSAMFGASGGISTVKHDERLSRYENVWRFKIKKGRVTAWYAARMEDGRVIWQDH